MFILTRILCSTIAYHCVNMVLYKLINIYMSITIQNLLLSLVLHHLDDSSKHDGRHPVVRETLTEAIRVLKKGGVIVIDTW